MIFTTFTFIYFFGNLVSLAEDLSPNLKSHFQKKFKKVITIVKSLNLEEYLDKIEVNIIDFFFLNFYLFHVK